METHGSVITDINGNTFLVSQSHQKPTSKNLVIFKDELFAKEFISWLNVDNTFWKDFLKFGESCDNQTLRHIIVQRILTGEIWFLKIDDT